MHRVDPGHPVGGDLQAMDLLVAQGKVIYVGSGNFAGWHIAKRSQPVGRGLARLRLRARLYNLDARTVELEVLPACLDYGPGVIHWNALGGSWVGVLDKMNEGRRGAGRVRRQVDANMAKLEAEESLCADIGHSPAHVALAWLLHNPAVTAPTIGPLTIEQLDGAWLRWTSSSSLMSSTS
ncbi:MAG TPA: aldo/keto reductase [Acidimicrobiales bacterium]|nr:aldo/keto reductase [Acidimicrobiales bacterium]